MKCRAKAALPWFGMGLAVRLPLAHLAAAAASPQSPNPVYYPWLLQLLFAAGQGNGSISGAVKYCVAGEGESISRTSACYLWMRQAG